LVGLAQAAAILVALGLAWHVPDRRDRPPEGGPRIAGPEAAPVRSEAMVTVDVDVPEGQIVVIRADQTRALVVDVTPKEMNTSSDPGLWILDVMESATTSQVAAR
jgi:hypothetical protein